MLPTGSSSSRVSGVRRLVVAVSAALIAGFVLAACGGSGRPAGLDQGAVAAADAFTRLAWNEHDCRAASRYASNAQLCASTRAGGMIPGWSHFELTSHRIRRTGCNLGLPPQHHQPPQAAGCIELTASTGFLLRYGMMKSSQGWRVVEISLSGSRSGSPAARLDRAAVVVADAFTKRAWNKHNCLAGSRYLLPGLPGAVCPDNPTGTFAVESHRIQPNSCGHGDWNGGYRISPGCIKYSGSNGQTLEYSMTKTPQGWRIIETGTTGHA